MKRVAVVRCLLWAAGPVMASWDFLDHPDLVMRDALGNQYLSIHALRKRTEETSPESIRGIQRSMSDLSDTSTESTLRSPGDFPRPDSMNSVHHETRVRANAQADANTLALQVQGLSIQGPPRTLSMSSLNSTPRIGSSGSLQRSGGSGPVVPTSSALRSSGGSGYLMKPPPRVSSESAMSSPGKDLSPSKESLEAFTPPRKYSEAAIRSKVGGLSPSSSSRSLARYERLRKLKEEQSDPPPVRLPKSLSSKSLSGGETPRSMASLQSPRASGGSQAGGVVQSPSSSSPQQYGNRGGTQGGSPPVTPSPRGRGTSQSPPSGSKRGK